MKCDRQLIRAVLIGPLAIIPAVPIGVLLAATFASVRDGAFPGNFIGDLSASPIYAIAGLAYSYPFTLLYGLPVYLILRKLNILNMPSICVMALLPGVALGIYQSSIILAVFMGYFSLAVAVLFYRLAPHGSNNSSNLASAQNTPSS